MDRMRQVALGLLVILASSMAANPALADRLLIEKVRETANAPVPRHGQTMDQVESAFGAPRQKLPAVGDPPITRWVYSGFTVYFEYQYVIDSVVHTEAEDQPA